MHSIFFLTCMGRLTVLLCGACFWAWAHEPQEQKVPDAFVRAQTDWSFGLYGQLRSQPDSLCFSPLSIRTCTATLWEGAGGESKRQLASVLRWDGQTNLFRQGQSLQTKVLQESMAEGKGKNILTEANAAWLQKGMAFKQTYLDLLHEVYQADSFKVDFLGDPNAVSQAINQWAKEKTSGMIEASVPPSLIDKLIRIVVVNAVYFKGTWDQKFEEDATETASFHLNDGQEMKSPFMKLNANLRYFEEASRFKLVELPYAGHRLAMLVFLPDCKVSLKSFEDEFTAENFRKWIPMLRESIVHVRLPRFELMAEYDLIPCFQALGVKDVFDSRKADLSGVIAPEELDVPSFHVRFLRHVARMQVNEEGTKAAAVTYWGGGGESAGPNIETFQADRPFVVVIWDRASGAILFMGRVVQPEQAKG